MFQCEEGTIKPIVYVGVVKDKKLLLVQYDQSPNPSKLGWWIPAPGLKFGEDPATVAAQVVDQLGLTASAVVLKGVETFVTHGGWHLIYHYVAQANSEPALVSENIQATRWVSAGELSQMKNIAHGQWEIDLGLDYLS